MDNLYDLSLELQKLTRNRNNIQKNYDRRKKLNLLDPPYERQLKEDLRKLDLEIAGLNRTIRAVESEQHRSKIINERK